MSQQHGSPSSRHLQEDEILTELKTLSDSSYLKSIKEALGENSKLHIVGGLIRDLALGKEIKDIDLACVLEPEKSVELLSKSNINTYDTGLAHGTITINIDSLNIELTTFRKVVDGENRFSKTIEEDLEGRDFTINALAYDIQNKKLIDVYSSLADIENKKLNAVEDSSKRITEDPLRVLRAIRFGPGLGFEIDGKLKKSIIQNKELLKNVSIERIKDEFCKILMLDNVRDCFNAIKELELDIFIIPELLVCYDFEQNEYHTEDVFNHIMTVVENSEKILDVRLAAFFHDIGKPASFSVSEDSRRHFYNHETIGRDIAQKVMKRMKFSKAQIKTVCNLVELHMRPFTCGPAGVRRLIRDLGDNLDYWLLLKNADKSPTMSEEDFNKEKQSFLNLLSIEKERTKSPIYGKMAISGDDLILIGMPPGKEMGKCLKYLQEILIENPDLNEKDFLLTKAREYMENNV